MTYIVFVEEEGKVATTRFDIEGADWGDARAKAEALFGVSRWSSALFCVLKDDLQRRWHAAKAPP